MSKKRRRRPDYRAPQGSATVRDSRDDGRPASRRPGGLFGLFAPGDPSASPYPNLRTSLGRGFLTVGSSLPILLTIVAFVFGARLLLVAIGVPPRGIFAALLLTLPPLGSFVDSQLSQQIFGAALGTPMTLVFLLVRTLVVCVLTGMIVESLERGSVSLEGVRRGLRGIPALVGVSVIGLGAVFAGSILAGVSGLGTLGLFGLMGVAMHLLAYAPAIAVARPMRLQAMLGASVRAARVPGSQNVVMAVMYAFLALLLLPGLVPRGAEIAANPSLATWIGILVANVVHVGLLATYCYRYMVAAPELPQAPLRRSR